jgi:antitoxin component YwqK of YwqJK toxin-antitoxin module
MGVEEGKWTSWFENGNRKTEGSFKAGRMDGIWVGFFPDGQPDFEGTYKDDLKNGPWKFYFESVPEKPIGGRVREEGSYAEGRKSGRWISYSVNGLPISEGLYANGTPPVRGPTTMTPV